MLDCNVSKRAVAYCSNGTRTSKMAAVWKTQRRLNISSLWPSKHTWPLVISGIHEGARSASFSVPEQHLTLCARCTIRYDHLCVLVIVFKGRVCEIERWGGGRERR
jgi:hypothetical protein